MSLQSPENDATRIPDSRMTDLSLPFAIDDLRSATLSDLQHLASAALKSASPNLFQHPLGFWFRTLHEDDRRRIRLHVWPLGGGKSPADGYNIHDHSFRFISRLLVGKIQHIDYMLTPVHKPSAHTLYDVSYSEPLSTLIKTDDNVCVKSAGVRVISVGEFYELDHATFHATSALAPGGSVTITVMERTTSANPRVVGPSDGPAVIEFARLPVDPAVVEPVAARLFPTN